jgi:radical SAM superfamily enzyme YgiQ (UPF0313 family)
VRVVLISTYELGRQPFGLASAAAWLTRAGHEVTCLDLAVEPFPPDRVAPAECVGFYLPMHTATRLAVPLIRRVRRIAPHARLAAFGLYAPLNEALLRSLGVEVVAGGEFEPLLVAFASGVAHGRLDFVLPDRGTLPPPARYAQIETGAGRKAVAYTEASRGCKHLCRHCPVVPVYQGRFRIVPVEIVLADIRQQVERGATHVTFGDPDFFNGPVHAARVLEALRREHPGLTYDITVKIEHLLRHRDLLPLLGRTGCLFVTSAVESVDNEVLRKLDKGHTREDFVAAVRLLREHELTLAPTFIPFTPWTTLASYRDLLRTVADLELVANTGSVQLALRLLITANSRLLELAEIRALAREYDEEALAWRWRHPDPAVDALAARLLRLVGALQRQNQTREQIFAALWREAFSEALPENYALVPRAAVPYLNEPWYC